MRLCIPTLNDAGLKAIPSDHFGSAPFFTLVDTSTEEIETIRNDDTHHVHGRCRPLSSLPIDSTDAIVCRGLGQRAFLRLAEAGVPVLITGAPDVASILAAYREDGLVQMTAEQACQGHGGSHGHSHSFNHGQGHGRMGGGCRD